MSKTFLCALLSVYFAIRYLKVIYLVPSAKQFDQALEYFEANPYIDKKGRDRKIAVKNWYFVGGRNLIHIDLMSINSVNSGRFNVIIYDEAAQLVYLPKKEALIPKSFGMLKAMYPSKKFFTSTPLVGAFFEKQEEQLRKQAISEQKQPGSYVSFRNFKNTPDNFLDIPAIMQERIEMDRLGMLWLWEQENLARYVVARGIVFPNVIYEESNAWNHGHGFTTSNIGVDFHGSFGQVVVEIFVDPAQPTELYVTGEKRFPQAKKGVGINLSWLQTCYPDVKKAVEGGATKEGEGGFNDGYARESKRYGAIVIPSDMATKSRILIYTLTLTIHIDERLTPELFADIRKATWEENKVYILKDKTHTNHYLDAFLVGIGGLGQGEVYDPGSDEIEFHGDYITALKILSRRGIR